MRVEEHEKDNATTYLDNGLRVHRIKIGIRYVTSIFDKDGMLCVANGFNTEPERETWILRQCAIILGEEVEPEINLENPEPESEISRKTDEHPLLGF